MGHTRPIIVPLGGFLGAGKTTLILAAARLLHARGLRAAAILNDQGSELVDTKQVFANGIAADQVAGGCFCCRFSDLIGAAERLRELGADVIFAEAVGSCTDISATTLQPLKLEHGDRFRLAPFTVLVDPRRAIEILADDPDADLPFLFRTQVDEADLICFTKSDLFQQSCDIGDAPTRSLSAITGQGVAEWLDEILAGHIHAGGKILEIDYQRYAEAEAALAWLNASGTVTLAEPLSPSSLIGPLVDELDAAMAAVNIRVVHLKLSDDSPSGFLKASLLAHGQEPQVSGTLSASPASAHELLLNIRAEGDPVVLQRIVDTQLTKLPGTWTPHTMQCFRPAPPTPEHRVASVAAAVAAQGVDHE
jgi:hypothetical protein